MNLFNKWIIRKAESIKASDEAKRKLEAERQERERQAWINKQHEVRGKTSQLRKKINEWYDTLCEGFNINEYYRLRTGVDLDFTEGDMVILNKYGLRMDSSNGWDGGANILLSRGGANADENPAPLFCKVKKVFVDQCYVGEIVDKFFESYTDDEILSWDNDIVDIFKVWLERRRRNYPHPAEAHKPVDYSNSIFDYYGLYVGVSFEVIDWDFNPSWSLNVFSFLNATSEDGQATAETWREVYETNVKIEELNEKQDKLRANMVSAKKRLLARWDTLNVAYH
jgi:hypothetical protein